MLYVERWLKAGMLMPDGTMVARVKGTPQGGLCSAEHKPPYAQRWIMRSVGVLSLVRARPGVERCA
jgi:RNA-directed DNA polymerase